MDEHRQCPECRFELRAEDSACPFCGVVVKKVPRRSAACGGWGRRPALKDCPDCGAPVSVRAESCPHCGCPAEHRRRPTSRDGRSPVGAIIGVVVLIVVANSMSADRRGAKAPPNPPRVAPGDRAVLTCKEGDGVFVAFGVEAWSRMAHAQVRRDTAEMHRLVDTGRAALVAAGTPVEVLGSYTMMVRLRLRAGPHVGREGWVRKEFVRPVPR